MVYTTSGAEFDINSTYVRSQSEPDSAQLANGDVIVARSRERLGQLHYKLDSAHSLTLVEGDTNGDKVADFQLLLTGLKSLLATDFLL